ncbi:hypothetical protein QFC19_006454 [Naganishia cerealis]|uniref:Uncharacterized protein n=1 Tax=Naganishia cerealis TaxID=610337 RepID=A0ACC2VGT7_9TREE|nr:hypothetical protein QFC19_006454 [Naganishia cerealis]
MMQRPQPPPAPTADKDSSSDHTEPIIDSDGAATDPEMSSLQPSMSYASRVPPQSQNQPQSQNAGPANDGGKGVSESTISTLLRRPILQRGSSGPAAPDVGQGAGTGSARPGARAMGPGPGASQPQPQDVSGLGGFDSGDGMGGNLPKAKPQQFDFHYDDTSDILSELSEFFPYAEMSHLLDNLHEFEIDFGKSAKWTEQSLERRTNYVQTQVEFLEHRDLEERMKAARRLTYLVQGSLSSVYEQNAQHGRPSFGQPPNQPPSQLHPGQHVPEELNHTIEDINAEIGVYLGIIYFVVEVFRHDETFGDELSKLTLCSQAAADSEGQNSQRIPGEEGKSPVFCHFTKVSPAGMTNFHKEITVKYPTFEVPPTVKQSPLNPEKLAEAMNPIPVRSHYHTSVEDGLPSTFVSRANAQNRNGVAGQPGFQGQGSLPQPGTPAPSPPPTPPMKPKKQQYQTDQSRPFVFPFSRSEFGFGPSRMVPFAIDEAEKLYNRHMHVSLGLYQLQKVREDYIREESGLGTSGLIGFTKPMFDDDLEEVDDKAWQDYQIMDWKYEEQEMMAQSNRDTLGVKAAQQARLSLKRLYRVELIYKATLSSSQSIIVVLLKLLLATVTGNPAANANANQQPGSPGAEPPGMSGMRITVSYSLTYMFDSLEVIDNPPQTLEEVDVARHREITSKAVSAILLLLLKWFKASHIMKFQHLATLLIDSNCLLLILKMFGFQDLLQTQILKRLLRVSHSMLQLQVLKVIKSQVPFCGRKWRQSNMKTITAIYLNCKPELRDEWLSAIDIDNEVEESNAAENALRVLIRFYHSKHYAISQSGFEYHRRSDSLASGGSAEQASGPPGSSVGGSLHRTDSDVFPPNRTLPRKETEEGDYNVETIMGAWLYEYEDLIAEVLGIDRAEEHVQQGLDLLNSPGGRRGSSSGATGILSSDTPWSRLNEIMKSRGMPDEEAISDSESVVSIGELGSDARFSTYDMESDTGDEPEDSFAARQRRKSTGNENTWEHISPQVSLLPKSPSERSRRRSSSGSSPLRPVTVPSAATDWLDVETFEEEEEPGPMPIQEGTEDEEARGHMPADEVEAFFQV